ncbi:MAG: S8 family serine peptidase, partial [Solirubrobacteraceae bacterium]
MSATDPMPGGTERAAEASSGGANASGANASGANNGGANSGGANASDASGHASRGVRRLRRRSQVQKPSSLEAVPRLRRLNARAGATSVVAGTLLAALAVCAASPSPSLAAERRYAPGVVVVGYVPQRENAMAASVGARPQERTRLVRLDRGEGVSAALRRLRRERGVRFAQPDYIAHVADVGHRRGVAPGGGAGAGGASAGATAARAGARAGGGAGVASRA